MAKVLGQDEERATPYHRKKSGRVVGHRSRWVVLGHHLAAIAGPGPLVGRVLASQFGYLPGTLWILIGATLGGGVHAALVMFASIRRGGKSVGPMLKEEVGPIVGFSAMFLFLAITTTPLHVPWTAWVKTLPVSP